jgi:transposase
MTTWLHEWLFRRFSREDCHCCKTWALQESQAAHIFSVSLSSVKRYVNKADHGESLAPKKKSPGSAPKLDEKATKLLETDLKQRPFATLQERRDYITLPYGTLGESLDDLPHYSPAWIKQKKRGRSATERDEFQRAAWRVMVAWVVEPERLLFVDECGVHTSLAPIYGYAPKDERLHLPVPRNRGKNTTLLSSMTTDGMGPSLAVEGATDALVFETYVQKMLVPSLRAGQIVVMDNLSAHKPKRIRELIEQQGCELLYLPAYSPDYNPIEEAFSKIKNLLRKAAARSKEALVEAIGQTLDAVTAEDALGYFKHAGYRTTAQLL